jgi:excisionase family DNA binding protein
LFWKKNTREGPSTQTEDDPRRGRNGTGSGYYSAEPEPKIQADSNFPVQLQPIFEPVLGSEKAAALLKIHPKTLQKLARDGKIPGVRIGKLWAFRASTLNRWLESKMPT